jgi:hypothetical protein
VGEREMYVAGVNESPLELAACMVVQ